LSDWAEFQKDGRMYGMVNRGLEQMVRSWHSDAAWELVKTRADVDIEGFISMTRYPDEMTYALVDAASVVLETPVPEVLRAFGHYWVTESAAQVYGELMTLCGRSLPEFLRNLDSMHGRLVLAFPKFEPPSFKVTDETATSLVLHYYSERAALGPFVVGLVEGLAHRFGTEAQVEIVSSRDGGADHEAFLVRYTAAA
jgi:hypothetical protein